MNKLKIYLTSIVSVVAALALAFKKGKISEKENTANQVNKKTVDLIRSENEFKKNLYSMSDDDKRDILRKRQNRK